MKSFCRPVEGSGLQCVPDYFDGGGKPCGTNPDCPDGAACLGSNYCQDNQATCSGTTCSLGSHSNILCDVTNGTDGNPDCAATNNNPNADNLQVDANYCNITGIPGSGFASFHWDYKDKENDPEAAFEIQVSKTKYFGPADIVADKQLSGNGNRVGFTVFPETTKSTNVCAPNCSYLNYNTPYYWRVKVWQAKSSQSSDWVVYKNANNVPLAYTYPYTHPGPDVYYTLINTPTPGTDPAQFTDSQATQTRCYLDDGTYYPCSCKNPNGSDYGCTPTQSGTTYNWTFGDNSTSNTKGPVSHNYVQPGYYKTQLQICDQVGSQTLCCSASQNISVGSNNGLKVPLWWEVSPF
jgi:hypothetical protein